MNHRTNSHSPTNSHFSGHSYDPRTRRSVTASGIASTYDADRQDTNGPQCGQGIPSATFDPKLQTSQVHDELRELGDATNALNDRVMLLMSRLSEVVFMEGPEVPPADSVSTAIPLVPIAALIHNQADMVRLAEYRLANLISRLGV